EARRVPEDVRELGLYLVLDRRLVRARDGAAGASRPGRGESGTVPRGVRDHVGDHPRATEVDRAHDQRDEHHDNDAGLDQRLAALGASWRARHDSPRVPDIASTAMVPSPSGTL